MTRILIILTLCFLTTLISVNVVQTLVLQKTIQQILDDANSCIGPSFEAPKQNSTYDYIIVGAGPAGSALAYRLSEDPNTSVYLLEAGGSECLAHKLPVLAISLQATESNWGYKSIPQKNSCFGNNDNIEPNPQGKSLGGSSSISIGVYSRGVRKDYDDWAVLGNDGWSYDGVLPYFLRAENSRLEQYQNSPYHNFSGSFISSQNVSYRTDIFRSIVEASLESGLDYIDYNDPDSGEGVSWSQATTLNGRRHSAYYAYIDPVLDDRSNLHVLSRALVTKILIDVDTKQAIGVNFEYGLNKYTVFAKKEVILSAGPFNSAKLLMVSGIGPKENLEKVNVPVIADLPVGKTLYDHVSHIGPLFTVNTTLATLFIDRITPLDIVGFETGNPSTRVSTLSGFEGSVFVKSSPDQPVRNLELILADATVSVDYGTLFKRIVNMKDEVYNTVFKPLEGVEHCGFLAILLYPESFGQMLLESSDFKVPPKTDMNYFSNLDDVEKILAGIKRAIAIVSQPGMQAIGAKLIDTKVPGCEEWEFGSDDYWRCSIRTTILSWHDYSSTCKMGPESDETSVVDSKLRVHGVLGLRVVDTSILPKPVGGHLEAVGYMIGEKAADIIRNEDN